MQKYDTAHAPCEDRTHDLRIMRPTLYQLSQRSCIFCHNLTTKLYYTTYLLLSPPTTKHLYNQHNPKLYAYLLQTCSLYYCNNIFGIYENIIPTNFFPKCSIVFQYIIVIKLYLRYTNTLPGATFSLNLLRNTVKVHKLLIPLIQLIWHHFWALQTQTVTYTSWYISIITYTYIHTFPRLGILLSQFRSLSKFSALNFGTKTLTISKLP